jgi:hypothetical protein
MAPDTDLQHVTAGSCSQSGFAAPASESDVSRENATAYHLQRRRTR